ncbi:MAG: fluoride efflux transporter FluC [Candidatus Competibacterales bacterium]
MGASIAKPPQWRKAQGGLIASQALGTIKYPALKPPLPMLLVLVAVFAGGTLGSLCRELLSSLLPAPWPWFPTLLINVAASFVVGWLFGARERLHSHVMPLAAVGFCGGLSTFSHFAFEVTVLLEAAAVLEAVAYPALAIAMGVAAAVAGEALGRRWGADTAP